jgi:hypothetical protein
MKVSLSSPTLARHGAGTLALDRPNPRGHRILRRNPAKPVDMVLHPMPCHAGAPPLPGPLTQHGPKQAPALALPRFLPSLRAKDHGIFTIPLCVASTLIRCCCPTICSWGPPSPQRAYDNLIFHYILRPSLERLPGQTRGLPIRKLSRAWTGSRVTGSTLKPFVACSSWKRACSGLGSVSLPS